MISLSDESLEQLACCELCEHRCRVNRLLGERGVCRMGMPEVASAGLHPAPPQSYTIFIAGCNFKCLNCQNWNISQYPDSNEAILGWQDPVFLAREALRQLNSDVGRAIGADRLFFSGGEPTIQLPYVEEVIAAARQLAPETKVNFDTNGFMTPESLERILSWTTSITYDLKAFSDETHRALTGAPVAPVLRNAGTLAREAPEKIWEFRIVVIPGINEDEVEPLSRFLAELDPNLPTCFLAFRPNFLLEDHPGAGSRLLEKCLETARVAGLRRASRAGRPDLPGKMGLLRPPPGAPYSSGGALMAGAYAFQAGCATHPRNCGCCRQAQRCPVKSHGARRKT
jgi:pyruvate formate lyase activating enzyme